MKCTCMPTQESAERARDEAVGKAEGAIQEILIKLRDEVGEIEYVEVDTRTYANLRVDITLQHGV